MVLNPAFNNQNNGCGTINKCSVCNFKIICEKSPYFFMNSFKDNLLNNNDNSNDIASLIDENSKKIDSYISTNEINNKYILDSISNINLYISELSKKIDDINNLINLNLQNKQEYYTVESNNYEKPEENLNISSGVVPYTNDLKEEKILVEKKNIFGKTKWVEKNIK